MIAVKTAIPCNGRDVGTYSMLEAGEGWYLTGLEVTAHDV